ncbi:MAG: M48 family metalloprotease, partial [Promethearchaeota archaeon]
FHFEWLELIFDWSFLITVFLYLLTIEEFYHWVRNNKRSEMSDLVAIAFFFFLIFFFSKDFLTSLMGAFSIYLWIGIFELKEYPVLNKILIISLVTYNIIFIAGILSFYQESPFFINTAFAFSFWIILIMGFLLFGRKYIIVWRFMSPEYLTLFLYIIAWLAVVFIDQYTALSFINNKPLITNHFTILDLFMNIYFILICMNWLIYFVSGVILDKMLGIKRITENIMLEKVEKVKNDLGIKGKVKVGYGKYPILNAMAYGSFFDKRIAIIAEDINQIPNDELNGILAHELAHTKGKHTLILTCIASGDLIFRMFLGLPATLYDYTFGKPQIPMIIFIFLNLALYILLFIFVRILEGKADLKAKKAGYANELAKALYNLESFYATGREIGFNTMLLCDEKITNDNQLLDYMNTAIYLNRSIIKPSRISLLGNFINSHPPSYLRIATILGDELKPSKEAILPFICLKKSKQQKYARKFESARQKFKTIANSKFKEAFGIKNIPFLMEKLRRKELYKFDLNKDYIFRNKITDEIKIGKLNDIQFLDDISESEQFTITNLKTNKDELLNSSLYNHVQIDLNEKYFFAKNSPLTLIDIELNKKNNKESSLIFLDEEKNKFLKPILKTKLPNSLAFIKNLKEQEIFFKKKGDLKISKCIDVLDAEDIKNYKLILTNFETKVNHKPEYLKYKINELIIKPKRVIFTIHKDRKYRESEVQLIKWLKNKKLLSYIYLKKPVNNLEIGFVQKINVNLYNFEKYIEKDEKNEDETLFISNIFGKEIKIPYNKIELIIFDYTSAMIQIKSETSFSSRLGYKILKKFKPERILIT